MDCLTPPLECVPLDEWFCPDCEPSRDDGLIGNGAILERVFDALEGAMSDIIGMYLFLGIRLSLFQVYLMPGISFLLIKII